MLFTTLFEESSERLDFLTIKQQLEGKVGGNLQDEKTRDVAFEGLEKALELIPLTLTESKNLPEINEVIGLLVNKDRLDFLKAYVEKEANVLDQIVADIKPIFTPKDEINFARTMQAYTIVSQRLLKIHNLMNLDEMKANETKVFEALNLDDETRKKMGEIVIASKESLAKSYTKIFNQQTKNINSIPENSEGSDRLDNLVELLRSLGILSFMKEEVAKKKGRMPKEDLIPTKKKKRIIVRLLRAIAISQLPAISNQVVDRQGDYFSLFRSLEKQNPAWMDLSLEKYVFGGNEKALSEFNAAARSFESATEEHQINYLQANRSWILSYIKSDKDGVLTDKEESNYVSQLETTCTEKEKEIKNYYLSRDFNISNVSGIQIRPEIRLPLYSKVKLAVSEKDRIKESPLRNIVGGALSIVGGLFSAIEDKSDPAALAAAQARNAAVFNGINAIVKGTVSLVGGKQAARDYKAGLANLGSKVSLDRITLSQDERKGRVKEDMLSTIDATGYAPVNPEAPGQSMQTPDSMAGTMDTFSLLGPGKKTKAKKKPQPAAGTKVMTFADFIGSKSKLD